MTSLRKNTKAPTPARPEFTRGPWRVSDNIGDHIYTYVINDEGISVAQVHRRANAHLIAAAPDLLRALEKIRDNDFSSSDWERFESIREFAAEVIAKAVGNAAQVEKPRIPVGCGGAA